MRMGWRRLLVQQHGFAGEHVELAPVAAAAIEVPTKLKLPTNNNQRGLLKLLAIFLLKNDTK
jgi:hypothetical protein